MSTWQRRGKRVDHAKIKRAHSAAFRAVRDGVLVRPTECSFLVPVNGSHGGVIEAHHPNYDKPLDIVWACRKCHRILDRIER